MSNSTIEQPIFKTFFKYTYFVNRNVKYNRPILAAVQEPQEPPLVQITIIIQT